MSLRQRAIAPAFIALAVAVIVVVAVAGILVFSGQLGTTPTNVSPSQTSVDTAFTTNFHYPISINYSGSWNLVYWGTNGTVTQYYVTQMYAQYNFTQYNFTHYNVKGNLSGSGNYETRIVTYGVGYVENTLCAKATKLDSQNLTLTLTVLTRTNSTTAFNPSAEVCATYGV